MSSLPNTNWNDPNNGKSNIRTTHQAQPSTNVSPPNNRSVPISGSVGGPQYGSSQLSNEYSRNPSTIGGPSYPLQQNQRGYLQNTGYPIQQVPQQRSGDKLQQVPSSQQQQQPLYQQYPPQQMGYLAGDMYNPQHQEYVQMNQLPNQQYNLQQRQQVQGQQLKSQLNDQSTMMSTSTQQYPVQDFVNPYANPQNPAEQQQQHQHQQQQQPLRGQSQQWDGYQSQPLYPAVGNAIPSSSQQPVVAPSDQQQLKQQQPSPPEQVTKKKPGRKPKSRKLSDSSSELPSVSKTASSSSGSPTGVNSGKAITKRSRMGCLTCRQRKKRCCETRPRCTECTRLRLNCTWPKPGTEHKNKPKDQKDDENTIEHAEFGRIKVLRGIVEYRSK
ncbi:Zn(2)-C6 fungal-type DNA-binding protein, putative [Candida dubliniensis CD36]|uniref:Zn(2)-C6 fungal-type DNA-binding protein, putative n=1 Tax=Candida dubliniensis (strain CD36 / ATCC MYA-646 / CBS 7987 / NCPF 3949 / NRRL Y-17841) TaxID=573826 RepID=B9WF37_CANDC|nr:Zn(2)-C6 fungal-type DNA-binding protein, putative [Candida dubliniensis CD36]CAX42493.1 Zn(2)-C6 fungal-type DNA-binding protein, putative [Candida dubliniensis CD36]